VSAREAALNRWTATDKRWNKPVSDWISAPSPNFVAMATWVSPEVQWIADFPQAELPCRERNYGWRCGNVALSQAILGSEFWALGGLHQKSKNNVL